MRRFLAHGLTLLVLALPASATTFSTDASDLWFTPTESGWGVNVVQQGDTLFLTFFVYAPNGGPVWYFGSAPFTGTSGGPLTFSGALFSSSGPWFGGSFIVAPVHVRPAGSVTFTLTDATHATLLYTIDGVDVSKLVQRQTWKANDVAGSYIGAQVGNYAGACPVPSGPANEAGTFSITTTVGGMEMIALTAAATCAFSGSYTQAGRMGSSSGAVTCSLDRKGQYTATEIDAGVAGLTGRLSMRFDDRCQWDGRFGGVRRGP